MKIKKGALEIGIKNTHNKFMAEFLTMQEEYQMAKQTYEAGFMSFLGTKFSAEYVKSIYNHR